MRLPNLERARIDIVKLTGYVLNASHPEGRHKARVFLSALGIGAASGKWLANAILAAIGNADAALPGRYGMGSNLSRRCRNHPRPAVREGQDGVVVRAGRD